MTFVGHSTVLLEVAGLRVLTDPVLTNRVAHLRRVVAPPDTRLWARGVDLILISHLHRDHLHIASLRRMGEATPMVVPRGAGLFMAKRGFTEVVELSEGETLTHGPLTITATPAVHGWKRNPIGLRAKPVGYLIDHQGWVAYFPGDTAVFAQMASLSGDLDLAMIPVWGWGPNLGPGHLDPDGAAEAMGLLQPRLVLPIHWGTLWPVGASKRLRSRLIDPPLEFEQAARRMGLDGEVLVTRPGEQFRDPG